MFALRDGLRANGEGWGVEGATTQEGGPGLPRGLGYGDVSALGRLVQVRATNYDGSPHWVHPAYLVIERGGLVVVQAFAGTRVETEAGEWESPFDTRGHYWAERWYNVIRLDAPSGGRRRPDRPPGLAGWYCNVATPVEFDGENLHYVDLQLDVRVYVEGERLRPEVIDEDDFVAATEKYAYPRRVVESARAAVEEILTLVARRAFPFEV